MHAHKIMNMPSQAEQSQANKHGSAIENKNYRKNTNNNSNKFVLGPGTECKCFLCVVHVRKRKSIMRMNKKNRQH